MKHNFDEVKRLINKLSEGEILSKDEFSFIIDNYTETSLDYAADLANKIRRRSFSNDVYLRGLVEISNYCKKTCKYCGIRAINKNVHRYRLTLAEIAECVKHGYELGFRSFVLQGGEDPKFTDEFIESILYELKKNHNDIAITLSIGEMSSESYQKFYNAGADRFLLRHEAASKRLFDYLHDDNSYDNRFRCLYDLREIGYQVGAGIMIGSPSQTSKDLADDLLFLQEFKPEMCGIGPYIVHSETPFHNEQSGSFELTKLIVALVRIMLPNCMLPATTALASVNNNGRIEMLEAGANVVMPNLSPLELRKDYEIYENKVFDNKESADSLELIKNELIENGFNPFMGVGHHREFGGKYGLDE